MNTYIYDTDRQFAHHVGYQLRRILHDRHISIKDFAISCNVSYNQMTGYIRGEHAPNWDILLRMCNYLHIHIDTLMPVTEEYRPQKVSDSGELTYVIDTSFQKQLSAKKSSHPQQGAVYQPASILDDFKHTFNSLWTSIKTRKKDCLVSDK